LFLLTGKKSDEALDLWCELCELVMKYHSLGQVHGNLSPDCFLRLGNEWRLLPSVHRIEVTHLQCAVGMPTYVSPELLQATEISSAVDTVKEGAWETVFLFVVNIGCCVVVTFIFSFLHSGRWE